MTCHMQTPGLKKEEKKEWYGVGTGHMRGYLSIIYFSEKKKTHTQKKHSLIIINILQIAMFPDYKINISIHYL